MALSKQLPAARLLQANDALAVVSGDDEMLVYVSVPAELAIYDAESEALLKAANDLTIDDADAESHAAEIRTQAKREATAINKMRLRPARKLLAAKQSADDIFASAYDTRTKVVEVVEAKLKAREQVLKDQEAREREIKETEQRKSKEKEERLAREATERAAEQQRQADELRQKAEQATSDDQRKSLESQARKLAKLSAENTVRADERLNRAELFAGEVVVEERRLNLGGAAGTRKKYKVRVRNAEAFVKAVASGEVPNPFDADKPLLIVNESALNSRATDLGMSMQYPGIEVYEDTGFVSSKQR